MKYFLFVLISLVFTNSLFAKTDLYCSLTNSENQVIASKTLNIDMKDPGDNISAKFEDSEWSYEYYFTFEKNYPGEEEHYVAFTILDAINKKTGKKTRTGNTIGGGKLPFPLALATYLMGPFDDSSSNGAAYGYVTLECKL